mmetsp:Transcript_7822/g.22283  ORF Transcript_7822/g.22283 Transcript_7822/m.22283 type:complete len:182 (+) Transcript_7822:388-933(+)|eukprot:CAMPEP_0117663418 /NCGR_PEP_ID=MMETSP0804-20121206/8595_1 /TAXON_ID=1074897 /ORGANISM="Tetraselmis astigmatica, Strain CCMP880" /LENGTH=181 /DNA_ID=CAMNT_0005470421 /DNA_START=338 /DNA_END=883 /DNA_ORIENTATION=-
MGKKRKADFDVELERGLYTNFTQAAQAVTQLYSQAAQAQRRSYNAGARASLEKMLHWLVREHGGASSISTAVVAQYLRREQDALDGNSSQWAVGGLDAGIPAPSPGGSPRRTFAGDSGQGHIGVVGWHMGQDGSMHLPSGASGEGVRLGPAHPTATRKIEKQYDESLAPNTSFLDDPMSRE